MTKNYAVQINLDAYIMLTVKASSREEARTIALDKFHEMSDEDILNQIGGINDDIQCFAEEVK